MKVCKICKERLSISCFYRRKGGKDGLYTSCKACLSKSRKTSKSREYQKNYYQNNKEKIKVYKKTNRDIIIKYAAEYRKNNKNKIQEYGKIYRSKNKDRINQYFVNRREKDPEFKLKQHISKRVTAELKKFCTLKDGSSFNSLPYTMIELKAHLESQFEPWMSWENWGKYSINTWDDNDSKTWNIDHIIPHSLFKYTSVNDKSFKQCWSLKNLRPYSSKKNIIDGNRRVNA